MRVGIDLGTTNSVVGYIKGGRPEAVANLQGEYWTPSVVQVLGGRILVGREAKENLPYVPEATVYSIKRFVGRSPGDAELERARKFVAYRVDDPPEGKTDLVVHLGDKTYSPVDISAMVLRKLVEDTEATLGTRPTEAVITVPAYFSERQKEATRRAGEAAGLRVLRLLDEPTAAALAFGMDTDPDANRTILVFDLGGGTFDVSILLLTSGMFTNLKITGDNFLGGDDFDNVILDRLFDELKKAYGNPYREDPKVRAHLKKIAEASKMALSSSNQHLVDAFIPPEGQRPMLALSLKLERAWLEQATKPLVDRAMEQVHRALREAELKATEIDHVLMVGGSSRIPSVLRAVEQTFGADKIGRQLNPMLCVGLGAAILAETIGSGKNEDDILVRVTAKSLGIEIEGGKFDAIIPAGTTLPMEQPAMGYYKTKETNEKEIHVDFFEGESTSAQDNEWMGDVVVTLADGVPSGAPVDVSIRLNRDGVATVSVEVVGHASAVRSATIERKQRKARPAAKGAAGPAAPELANVARFIGGMARACAAILERFPNDKRAVAAAAARIERALEVGDAAEQAGAREEGLRVIQTVAPDVYIFFVGWNEAANPNDVPRAQRCDALVKEVSNALSARDDRAYNAAMDQLAAVVKKVMDERAAAGGPAMAAPIGGLQRR